MVDWLPWGFVLMIGTFWTLALVLRVLEHTAAGDKPNLRSAKWALLITIFATFVVYSMYLLYGERWIWYLR